MFKSTSSLRLSWEDKTWLKLRLWQLSHNKSTHPRRKRSNMSLPRLPCQAQTISSHSDSSRKERISSPERKWNKNYLNLGYQSRTASWMSQSRSPNRIFKFKSNAFRITQSPGSLVPMSCPSTFKEAECQWERISLLLKQTNNLKRIAAVSRTPRYYSNIMNKTPCSS